MTLPSQHGRGGPRRRVTMSRRRRRKIPLPLLFAGLVVLGAGGWFGFGLLRGGPERASAEPIETESQTTPDTARAERDAPPAPTPVVLEQGGPVEALPEPTGGAPIDALPDSPASRQDTASATREPPEPARERVTSSSPPPPAPSTGALAEAERLLSANKPLEARTLLNRALRSDAGDASALRTSLAAINEEMIFGPVITPGDPLVASYEVQPGDSLERIAKRESLGVDWRLVQRVNRVGDPRRIRVGQKLKLVRGPFHAIVDKSDYRLDLYHGPPDKPGEWLYVRSFPVGLGEANGTPLGDFVVKPDSKLVNPHWRNPRTGERFDADDPANPIGERWIGLLGVGDSSVYEGYGIHGTIEPDSIGENRSMGCVRMRADDVEVVYEMLVEGSSRVQIVP